MKHARDSAAKPTAANAFASDYIHARRYPHAKSTGTIGEIIVALTNEARRFVHDEKELYEVVAYLLDARPSRRHCSRYFWRLCADMYIEAVLGTHGRDRHST